MIAEEVHRLCNAAYRQGIQHAKANAIEAFRLRCCHLLGNRCMDHSTDSEGFARRVCNGKCVYIRRYEFELYKLEP